MNEQAVHILIVEDDGTHAERVRRAFAAHAGRYRISVAGSLREARDRLAESRPDLIITELILPDGHGLELLSSVEQRPDFPLMLMIGQGNEQMAREAIQAGALDYVVKSDAALPEIPRLAERVLREWVHIVARQRAEEILERTTQDLNQTVDELKDANQRILEQQKSVIEEERLKVMLQLAGAMAHELNQPLTALLGNIELLRLKEGYPQGAAQYIAEMEGAGKKIVEIVHKIQNIRHYEIKTYLSESSIINIDQQIKILSVEDSDDDFKMINAILEEQDQISLSRTKSIHETMELLQQSKFDVILLDYLLPDGNGFDFFKIMYQKKIGIPVVIITGQGNEMIASQLIKVGAYDYLTKEILNAKSLARSITNALEKSRLRRELGEAERKIAELTTRDELTGLYNRRYFMEALEREMERAKRYESELVLSMMHLDHFQNINDKYGNPAGDRVLSEFARMLEKCVRRSDLACRYAGEEFALIMPNTKPEKARAVFERLREMVVGHPFKFNASHFQLTVHAGFASYDNSATQSPIELVTAADHALCQAKKAGRNRINQAIH